MEASNSLAQSRRPTTGTNGENPGPVIFRNTEYYSITRYVVWTLVFCQLSRETLTALAATDPRPPIARARGWDPLTVLSTTYLYLHSAHGLGYVRSAYRTLAICGVRCLRYQSAGPLAHVRASIHQCNACIIYISTRDGLPIPFPRLHNTPH